MKFASAVSEDDSTEAAAEAVVSKTRSVLPGAIDLAIVFFTADHRENAAQLLEQIHRKLSPNAVIGCSAEGVLGADREIERSPGVTLFAGTLPGVKIQSFHIPVTEWKPLLSETGPLAARVGCIESTRALIGFGDPFSTPINQLLLALDRSCAHAPLIGGMASSGRAERENVLFYNDEIHDQGMVGLSLSGPIEVQTIVSQGCRPIGKPMVITKGQQNVLLELGGKPALPAVRQVIEDLPESDRELLSNGLMIGRAISEYRDTFGRGDFLIRGIVGANEEAGAVAIGDAIRVGQTVQLFVRDAQTAHEDLEMLLQGVDGGSPPAGGLLFSCNGRGTRLFDHEGHDVQAAHKVMPTTPMAGFFAAGELGPVGGQNFIHGHTASFALFRPM